MNTSLELRLVEAKVVQTGQMPKLVDAEKEFVVTLRDDSLHIVDSRFHSAVRLPTSLFAVGLAVNYASRQVEILDARGPATIVFDRMGTQLSKQLLPNLPITIRQATKRLNDWFVGGVSPSGDYVVFRYRAGKATAIFKYPRVDERVPARLHLGTSQAGLLVNDSQSPYRAYEVQLDGVIKSFPLNLQGLVPASPSSKWLAMPIVALHSGYILPLANIASDERLFVMLDKAGKMMRHRKMVPR